MPICLFKCRWHLFWLIYKHTVLALRGSSQLWVSLTEVLQTHFPTFGPSVAKILALDSHHKLQRPLEAPSPPEAGGVGVAGG